MRYPVARRLGETPFWAMPPRCGRSVMRGGQGDLLRRAAVRQFPVYRVRELGARRSMSFVVYDVGIVGAGVAWLYTAAPTMAQLKSCSGNGTSIAAPELTAAST